MDLGLQLRKVAPKLDIDQAILSKIENGHRKARKEHIPILAKVLQIEERELLVAWFATQIKQVTKDDPVAYEALRLVAEEEVEYKTKKQKEK